MGTTTVTARLRFRDDSGNVDTGDRGVSNLPVDAGEDWDGGTRWIGTNPEMIINNPPGSGVGHGGYLLLKNCSETIQVNVGLIVGSGFEPFTPLAPLGVALFPICQTQYWAQAVGGLAKLEVILAEAA